MLSPSGWWAISSRLVFCHHDASFVIYHHSIPDFIMNFMRIAIFLSLYFLWRILLRVSIFLLLLVVCFPILVVQICPLVLVDVAIYSCLCQVSTSCAAVSCCTCFSQWSHSCGSEEYCTCFPCHSLLSPWLYINGLVQNRRKSCALAMELHLSCTNPSI